MAPPQSALTPSSLPPLRLVITSHDPTGRAMISHSGPVPKTFPMGPQGPSFATTHSPPTLPASPVDLAATAPPPISSLAPGPPTCPPAGATFVVLEIPPGVTGPLHRTASIDYSTVLVGEIVLLLEGGEETAVKAGELIMQGGVKHGWANRGKGICRVLFVMVGAEERKE